MTFNFSAKKKYPLIIGGFYRSGTTLLRRLINAHSHIYCGPEVKFFRDFYAQYEQDPYAHIRFFSTARTLAIEEDQLLAVYLQAYIKIQQLAAKNSHKKRWADKNPENVLFLQHWQAQLANKFFFVHMVRNPLDVIASAIEAKFDKTIPVPFEEKVMFYKKYLQAAQDFTLKYPEQSLLVKYEDLVCHQQQVLTSLLMAIGESFEASILAEFNQQKPVAVIEDPKANQYRTISDASVGRWKKDLSAPQVHYIQQELAELVKPFGYLTE